jgi:hypothetical protein
VTIPCANAAVGFSIHTGWAAAVVVTGPPLRVLARRKIELADGEHDARFLYHVAREHPGNAARILEQGETTARVRATTCLQKLVQELPDHTFVVALPGPKRMLPALSAILASHPLIHSAEGELFRRAIADAARNLGVSVEIVQHGKLPLIAKMGPPWGKDQKDAAALAWAALTAPKGATSRQEP